VTVREREAPTGSTDEDWSGTASIHWKKRGPPAGRADGSPTNADELSAACPTRKCLGDRAFATAAPLRIHSFTMTDSKRAGMIMAGTTNPMVLVSSVASRSSVTPNNSPVWAL
jgi:hypothetical protein